MKTPTLKTPTLKTLVAATALAGTIGLGVVGLPGSGFAMGFGSGPGGCAGQGGGPAMMDGRSGGYGGGPGMMGRHHGGAGRFGGSGGPLAVMDADQDGTLTRAEFDSFHTLAFKAMDTDGDGQVSREAFLEARSGPGMTDGDWTSRRADRRAERLGARFDRWDQDGNGVVLAGEFESVAAAQFAQLDVDGDGTVTKQEMAVRAMFGPRGPQQGAGRQ